MATHFYSLISDISLMVGLKFSNTKSDLRRRNVYFKTRVNLCYDIIFLVFVSLDLLMKIILSVWLATF